MIRIGSETDFEISRYKFLSENFVRAVLNKSENKIKIPFMNNQ